MLKRIITIIFLLPMLVQTFSRAIIVFDYYTNAGIYAKNCENKAIPQMHCNGKCQMMQKLKKEEKKDEQNPERKSETKSETYLSSKSFFTTIISIAGTAGTITYPGFTSGSEIKMPRSLFHPPDRI